MKRRRVVALRAAKVCIPLSPFHNTPFLAETVLFFGLCRILPQDKGRKVRQGKNDHQGILCFRRSFLFISKFRSKTDITRSLQLFCPFSHMAYFLLRKNASSVMDKALHLLSCTIFTIQVDSRPPFSTPGFRQRPFPTYACI